MIFPFCIKILKVAKAVCLQPLVWVIDKIYVNEVHSKHEKIAKDVNSLSCTPSAFLDKPRQAQLEILAVDTLILLANMSLIVAFAGMSKYLHMDSTNWIFSLIYTFFAFDLGTGLIHFCLDDPFTKQHPIPTVKSLAWQFQDHHDKPYDNTLPPLFHTLFNLNFIIFPAIICNGVFSLVFNVNMTAYNVFCFGFAIFSQYVHRSIHYLENQRAGWMMLLMELGVVQSITNHHKHHKTFDCHYATLNGWSDSLLHFLIHNFKIFKHNNPNLFAISTNYIFLVMPLGYVACEKLLL